MRITRTGATMIGLVPILTLGLFTVRHAAVFGDTGPHLSNFALSLLIVFSVGAVLSTVGRARYTAAVAGLLVVANVLVETFVTAGNTPDLTDAAFGVAGVVVACGLLAVFAKKGTRRREDG